MVNLSYSLLRVFDYFLVGGGGRGGDGYPTKKDICYQDQNKEKTSMCSKEHILWKKLTEVKAEKQTVIGQ